MKKKEMWILAIGVLLVGLCIFIITIVRMDDKDNRFRIPSVLTH